MSKVYYWTGTRKNRWGWCRYASATDYCFATKFASAKLSELAIGIGPFVVGPAVERKVGTSAFSAMTINATKWLMHLGRVKKDYILKYLIQ